MSFFEASGTTFEGMGGEGSGGATGSSSSNTSGRGSTPLASEPLDRGSGGIVLGIASSLVGLVFFLAFGTVFVFLTIGFLFGLETGGGGGGGVGSVKGKIKIFCFVSFND